MTAQEDLNRCHQAEIEALRKELAKLQDKHSQAVTLIKELLEGLTTFDSEDSTDALPCCSTNENIKHTA